MDNHTHSYWNVGHYVGFDLQYYSSRIRGVAMKAVHWLGRVSVFAASVCALSASVASDQLAYMAGQRAAVKGAVVVDDPVAAKIFEAQWLVMQRRSNGEAE